MPQQKSKPLDLRHIIIYALLGSVMFASKKIMEAIPNVHLLGMLIMSYTLVYRKYALIPIYLYILLDGIFFGFSPAWVPYLYIWAVLWGATMLLPKNMPPKVAVPVYVIVCGLHGLCFGLLYAPGQMLLFHMSFKALPLWLASGLPYDLIHCISNCCMALLILPLSNLLRKLDAGKLS